MLRCCRPARARARVKRSVDRSTAWGQGGPRQALGPQRDQDPGLQRERAGRRVGLEPAAAPGNAQPWTLRRAPQTAGPTRMER